MRPASRDLITLGLLAVLAFAVGSRFEFFEAFERWVGRAGRHRVDELLTVGAVLVVGFAVFAYRRWRDLQRDLSARLRAEERLRESEDRFRCLSDATTEAVAIHDNGRILEVNAAFGVMFKVGPPEAVGMNGLDLVHPEFLEAVREQIATGSPEPYEATLLRRDGTPFPARLVGRSIPYRGHAVRVVAIRDLTERKLAEEALRESEERYRRLVELSPDAIAVHSDGRFVFANQAAARLLGAEGPEDLVGRSVLDIVHPDYHDMVLRRISWELRGESAPLLEEKFVRLDGRVIDVEVAGIPIKYLGEPGGQVVARDITQRKEAERQLREAEARYRALVEQIPAVTYTWDSTHGLGEAPVPYISPQIEAILGFPREDWLRDPEIWIRQTHLDDREELAAEWARTDETGEPFRMEYRMLAQDGRVIWIRDEAVVVARDPSGRPTLWQGIMSDVTEQKRIEWERRDLLTRLVGAQEEERRRIAGDIHDDSVQKMTAVGLRLQTLKNRATREEQIEAIDRLEGSVSLAISRLRHLLFELRPPAIDHDGLAAALRQYLEDVRDEAEIDVSLDDRLVAEPPPEIRVTAYRIAQEALTNVRKHAQATRVDVLLQPMDGGILVRVHDDGRGFDTDSLSGSAPGHLGFTAMRERAQFAGGRLRIDSAPGMGSTVEFWLPVVDAEPNGARL